MNLLVPAALAFGLIIPIILLLYFMRPKRQQRTIASTLLWQQALQDMQASRPWQRLRITPLLILQILAAIFIVLVLARPAVFANSSISGDTIIILQASASMQATDVAPSRFESARSDIANIIDNLGPNDHLSLITMARTPQVMIADSNDQAQLNAALQRARVTNQDADLEQALSLANSLMNGRNMQVLIVGDGHVSSADRSILVPFSVRYLRIGTDAPNAALLTLSARTLASKLVAFAQVANYSAQPRAIPVELYADGKLVSVQTVTLAPQGTGAIEWTTVPQNTRFLHAQILTQDAMSIDHQAWAIVGGSQQGRVLLVTKDNSFLRAAFALQPNVNLSETTPQQYVNTGNYDLTIFDGYVPPTLPPGSLFFVNPPVGSYLFGTSGPVSRVSRVGPGDDTLNLLDSVDLSSIHTLQFSHPLKPAAWEQSIISAPEMPLLIAGENNNRRVAVLGFDLHDSDLGLQPSFPILVHNLANWFLPQPVPGDGQVTAGSAVTVQTWPGADRVTITSPDAQVSTVGPPLPALPYNMTDQLGIYQVTQRVHGQLLAGAFTVNLFDATQSQLAPAKTLPILRSSDFAPNGNAVSHQLREIWPWIAALLLLVLCAEWWFFSRGYHVQKAPARQLPGREIASGRRIQGAAQKHTFSTRVEGVLQERYLRARKQFLKATKKARKRLGQVTRRAQ
ncbi:MAG: BatA and WFA domain-containing protein [Chloroflexota bacterium]|nr:BatA and WFA domain-containing protein [Chloroflexota bacterium]